MDLNGGCTESATDPYSTRVVPALLSKEQQMPALAAKVKKETTGGLTTGLARDSPAQRPASSAYRIHSRTGHLLHKLPG